MKTIIITGASGDIGKAISETFAKNNFDLVLCYNKNEVIADKLKNELEEKFNTKIITVKIDISSEEQVVELKKKVIDAFGRIDVLVNNAAVELSCDIQEKNYLTFKSVLDVNVIGTFLMCKHIGSYMVEQKFGKIVNVSIKDEQYKPAYDVLLFNI